MVNIAVVVHNLLHMRVAKVKAGMIARNKMTIARVTKNTKVRRKTEIMWKLIQTIKTGRMLAETSET